MYTRTHAWDGVGTIAVASSTFGRGKRASYDSNEEAMDYVIFPGIMPPLESTFDGLRPSMSPTGRWVGSFPSSKGSHTSAIVDPHPEKKLP